MTFGEKVRELRKKKKLSQTELGKSIGVSLRTIRGWEKEGRYPQKRELYTALARTLECDTDYLMTEKESFITDAGVRYGFRGAKGAAALMEEVTGLFAGGDMAEEDMDTFMLAVQQAYVDAKRKNKKYTPKKYRKDTSFY